MRVNREALLALSVGVLVGSAVVLAVLWVARADFRTRPVQPPSRANSAPPVVADMPSPGNTVAVLAEPPSATGLGARAEQLQQRQDDVLQLLVTNPSNERAMARLVAIRRELTGDDAVKLRRSAGAYRRALAEGSEVEEHYAPAAVALLAEADELAAAAIEKDRAAQGPTRPNVGSRTTPVPSVAAVAPTPVAPAARTAQLPPPPRATPRPRTTRAPRIVQRTPLPTPPAAPAPTVSPTWRAAAPAPVPMQRPIDESEPFYVARIGPIGPASRAHEIAAELTQAGLEATVNRRDGDVVYQVLSETLAAGPAERRVASLTALGYRPQLRTLPGGLARVVIATSSARMGAESLARQVRSKGYFAQVIAEGGSVHMITVGPYRRSAVDAIVRRVRSRFGAVPVVVDQVE